MSECRYRLSTIVDPLADKLGTPQGVESVSETIIKTEGISKDFGPVRVLFDIDLDLQKGGVHAIVGENGAGKSTLMKILSGYLQPSEGTITLAGNPVTIPNSDVGEQLGVVLIHQEFNLAEHLTVEENIFLGRELRRGFLLDKKTMRARSRDALSELEVDIDPDIRVQNLSLSHKQMVEIAKALSRNARVLIMDEPTAVLTPSETEVLFKLIRKLQAQGVTVIYISHKLDEVKAIADRVTVLRDGQLITTQDASELSQDQMASLMVGRELKDMYPDKGEVSESEVVLEAEHITVPGWVHDASFELRKGEILGFAGLIGAGRTELMEGLLGLRPRTGGTLFLHGKPVQFGDLKDATRHKVVYLSEDRKGKGLITSMQLRPNVTLLALEKYCRPLIDRKLEQNALEQAVDTFDIRVGNLDAHADTLSGGNQQKLVLAKIMDIDPDFIILDEPTRGIDVGTKRQLYFFIHELVDAGKSCILISSELPEVIGLSHRVVVMRLGVITGVLEGNDINEEEIVRYATGLKGKGVPSRATRA